MNMFENQLNGKTAQENYIEILKERQRKIEEKLYNRDSEDNFTLKIISEVKR